jgi:sortase (surface protein transpeptidase)
LKLLRSASLLLLLAGAVAFAAAACGGGGAKDQSPTVGSSETGTPESTATPAPTNTPSPTPSPTPYNGAIARVKIPRLGVDAPIEELAINSRGELDTPKGENTNVGWYHIYDKPGRTNPENLGWKSIAGKPALPVSGNAVFSAHIYYHNVPAPFVNLAKAQVGDEIVIQMEDGREYKYQVVKKDRYHRDNVPMGEIIWPTQKPEDKEWVTMITCGGALDETGQEYISRDVVVAERVS